MLEREINRQEVEQAQNLKPLQEANLSIINQYIEFKKPSRVYRDTLRYYACEVTKPVPEADELDVIKFLERHCKKGGAWNSYLSTIRMFYKWLINKDRHVPTKKWKVPAFFDLIEWKDSTSDKYNASDMWTEEEILLVISTCDHPRDKAVVALGYDVAGRPTELIKMKIKDVMLKENYGQVRLVDHTGERNPYITIAFKYLLEWINCHPLKDNPEAPLWISLKTVPKRLGNAWIYDLLVKRIKPKLEHKIRKPFNPYCIFDHSRLTALAEKGFTDTHLKAFRNWTANSPMPKRYLHWTGKGSNDKLLELAGLKKPDMQTGESPLQAKKCYRCNYHNVPDARYCIKCNFVLSAEGFEEQRAREDALQERLDKLSKYEKLEERLAKLESKDKEQKAMLRTFVLIRELPVLND
jgi:integrase